MNEQKYITICRMQLKLCLEKGNLQHYTPILEKSQISNLKKLEKEHIKSYQAEYTGKNHQTGN